VTAAVLLASWTLGVAAAAWLTWKGTRRHGKVYLLILYNAGYLAGVFFILSRCIEVSP
jgi:hypothetical protein